MPQRDKDRTADGPPWSPVKGAAKMPRTALVATASGRTAPRAALDMSTDIDDQEKGNDNGVR